MNTKINDSGSSSANAQMKATNTKCVGLLSIKSANDWIDESMKRPDPRIFFNDLIVEYENTVIFSASNVGKSILAVQIAEDIAKVEKVLYVDLELSAKQFQMRYYDVTTDKAHRFSNNFSRAEITPELMLDASLETGVLASIERAAKKGTKFFIIDNITFLCNGVESGIKAGLFMKQLVRLKKKYGLTTIIIAHTPKRKDWKPITQNDLAGSAKLINFFDAGIALARSAYDCKLRYLKQVKVRTGEFLYDSDNVLLLELNKDDGFLRFDMVGCDTEDNHLKKLESKDVISEIKEILMLQNEGMSVRQIAEEKNMSKSTVQRRLDYAKANGMPTSEEPVPISNVPESGQMSHQGQANNQNCLSNY